jgi:hypothetical protein
MERPTRARRRKLETAKADLQPPNPQFLGGQGVHREVESEGHEEKYRVVVDEARATRARAEQIELRFLDAVLGLAALAVKVVVQLDGFALEVGVDEAWVGTLVAVLQPRDDAGSSFWPRS